MTKTVGLAALLGALCWLLLGAGQALADGAVEPLPACTANAGPGEDASVPAPLGFTADFRGTTASAVAVNENGNVTFDAPRSDFAPVDLATASDVMIAPFLADVDVAHGGSITYGDDVLRGTTTRYFCVDWTAVPAYGWPDGTVDTFQLLLTQSAAQAPRHDFTITFNYDTIEWDTAGTTAAAAGFSAGNGLPDSAVELPGSGTPGGLMGSLAGHSHGSTQPGRYVYPVANVPVAGGSLHGSVYRSDMSTPALYVPVQVCRAGGACITRSTNYVGQYTAAGLTPGEYDLTATPAGDAGTPATVHVTVGCGATEAPEIDLGAPATRTALAVAASACGPSPTVPPPFGAPPAHPPAPAPSLSAQLHGLARRVARRLAAGRRSFALALWAAAPGTAVIEVRRRSTKVAAGRLAVARAGLARVTVRVTRRGRALLRDHRRLRLTLTVALGGTHATERFSVRRRR